MFSNVYFICIDYRLQVYKQVMLFIPLSIKSCYRNSTYKNRWRYQNNDKKIHLIIADFNLMAE